MIANLTTEERLLVNSEVQKNGKNLGIAYLFWFFLGGFGAHRFYLGKKGSAIAQLILTLTVVGIVVSGIWVLVDAFLIPGIVREINDDVEQKVGQEIVDSKQK